jgi:hypothetical protein
MDRQMEAIIESCNELNQECLQELVNTNKEVQEDVQLIVMQTSVSINADSEWDGLTQTFKKKMDEVKAEVAEVKKTLGVNQKQIIQMLESLK